MNDQPETGSPVSPSPQLGQQSRPPLAGPPNTPPPPPPGYNPAPYTPPKQHGILHRLAVSLITTVLIGSVGMNIYFAIILSSQFKTGMQETNYAVGSPDYKVIVVPVYGTIDSSKAEFMRQAFVYLEANKPDAIVLRIDSGGGGVTASDQIWHRIKQFKAKHEDVPIVASFGTVAASGGYYIAAPTDFIVGETTGITGSIGVMAQAPTLQGLMQDKLGIKWETLVADGSPDKDTANNIYRDWTDEDRAVFKKLLNTAHDRFVEVVVDGRQSVLSEDEVRALATGDIFSSQEAKTNKLIDEVGYLDDAIAQAATMANIPSGEDPTVNFLFPAAPLNLKTLLGVDRTQGFPATDPESVRSWLQDFSAMRIEYRYPW